MIGVMAGVVGLLAAGFAFGCIRIDWAGSPSARAARRRITTAILVVIASFPIVTLMLAKLFSSDLLGWIFGLSLIAGIALLPCATIFYAGLRVGRRCTRATRGGAATHDPKANVVVQIERGSVHASDEAPSKHISVPPDTAVSAMVSLAIADRYMPSIAGGQATWIVESSGAGAGTALRPIAVWAQQWQEVKFLIAADVSVAAHFGTGLSRLNLNYRCQDNPNTVLAALKTARR